MYYYPENMNRNHCHDDKNEHENNKHHDCNNKHHKMHQAGMHQIPSGQMPMSMMPMNQMPVNTMPMGQMPMNQNPMNVMPEMYKTPQKLVDLLVEAMKDERSDRAKYKAMMEMTCSDKCRKQINFAFEDEGKHYKMFQYIYRQLTGQDIEIPLPRPDKINSLKEAIEGSIQGELEAVELYRKIYAMLPNRQMRDMLYEIITDEQEHATRFVYLCGCVKC